MIKPEDIITEGDLAEEYENEIEAMKIYFDKEKDDTKHVLSITGPYYGE